MPFKAKRPCPESGCPNLVSDTRYCPAHTKNNVRQQTRRRFDQIRGTRQERGYGQAWQKLRLIILRRDPFCMIGVICDSDNVGNRAVSKEVDHIVPKSRGGTDAEENLQGACHACHSHKTATEDSTFANTIKAL